MRCPHWTPHLHNQAALCATNVCILVHLLGAAAVSGNGATTIGTGLTQPPASGLPMFLAGTPVSTHRRLLDNIFANRASLRVALNAYDDDAATAEATYGPIANWDVSAITEMSYLFWLLQNFNADVSSWDTSGVTSMYGMFAGARAFNQPLSFDTSNVTDMRSMFSVRSARDLLPSLESGPLPVHAACAATPYQIGYTYYESKVEPYQVGSSLSGELGTSAFNQPLSLDTSSVTDMADMFSSASVFNQPLSLDTASVTNMQYMFSYASAFNQPLSLDTSSVTSMQYMFWGALAFNQPLSLDTSSVTDMHGMLAEATSFNQSLSFDTSSVTDMQYMFWGALAFNQPLSFDISSITTNAEIAWMFDGTSLSDANRALISCAWAGNQAFEDSKALGRPFEDPDPSEWPSIACQDGLPSYSDVSQSSCDGGCMGGIVVGCGVLVLMCTGWLSGVFAKFGCPSPFKKPTRLPEPNRDSTTSKPTTSAV